MSRPVWCGFIRMRKFLLIALGSLAMVMPVAAQDKVLTETVDINFELDIQPLLESACINCHGEDLAEGELRLDTRAAMLAGGTQGSALVPGKPLESLLYTTTVLAADEDGVMPPEEALLNTWQTDKLKAWIEQGAPWPEGVTLKTRSRVDFERNIKSILEANCLSCHRTGEEEGGLDLTTQELAFETGDQGDGIEPFRAEESSLYTLTILAPDDDAIMPPTSAGQPLTKDETDLLKQWIEQGANWPEDVKLKPVEKIVNNKPTSDTMELVRRIHSQIVAKAAQDEKAFENYTSSIPRTQVEFSMIAVSGGEFLMGSPDDEAERESIEGPQRTVKVDPFWIGKCEVTWDEYEPYMITQVDRYKWGARKDYDPAEHELVDAVSQPTAPYTEMSFGMGQKGFPAISMTQHAANKYCQWLSAQTGYFYRLPTEAEWEYACRAGTETAYSFGDDPSKLGEYAWYYENSNEKYQKVGKKQPNPWGIHDMHGNVMEWTADQFSPEYFKLIGENPANPFLKPETLYPRTVRGGSWYDDAEQLRSAYRRGSDPSWKQQDPQLPKSIWYHTNAQWLGFRIVRPKEIPSPEEMYFYWNSAADLVR